MIKLGAIDEVTLTDMLEAISTDLDKVRSDIRSRRETPMKYALESLPELIGEQDFEDLCVALGIADDMRRLAGSEGFTPGKFLAGIVRNLVVKHHRDDARRARAPDIMGAYDRVKKSQPDLSGAPEGLDI